MRGLRRPSALSMSGAGILAALVTCAVLAPWLAPYDPRDPRVGVPLERPSSAHLLGTNDSGQDIWSQLLWGARPSLIVAAVTAAVVVLLGGATGIVAALLGGWVDRLCMRLADVVLALPGLPMILLLAAMLGPGRYTVVVVLGIFGWPRLARVVRGQALSLRQRGYVVAARGFGGGPVYLVRRHVAPTLGPVLATGFVNVAGVAILLESGLAFLGVADPTDVSWGSVLNRALAYPGVYYNLLWMWWVLPAGLAITLAVLGFTFLGVGLETTFNPRTESSR